MSPKSNRIYSRSLKLGPAIGDWTTIQLKEKEVDDVQISQIQNINFDNLPRELMNQLHYQHYQLADKIVQQFSKDMHIKIELHTIKALQLPYENFVNMQQENVVQTNFVLPNIGLSNLIFDFDLAGVMVNRLIGGKGDTNEMTSFSDIEQSILEAQMEATIPHFSQAWANIISPDDISLDFTCGDFQYDRKSSLREAYVIFIFYLHFGEGELKRLIWAYPTRSIRRLHEMKSKQKQSLVQKIDLKERTLDKIKVDVRGVLGSGSLKMTELNQLQVGDVIPLDQSFNDPVTLHLDEDIRMLAQPGIHENRYSLQVLSIFETKSIQIVPKAKISKQELPDHSDVTVPIMTDTFTQAPSEPEETVGEHAGTSAELESAGPTEITGISEEDINDILEEGIDTSAPESDTPNFEEAAPMIEDPTMAEDPEDVLKEDAPFDEAPLNSEDTGAPQSSDTAEEQHDEWEESDDDFALDGIDDLEEEADELEDDTDELEDDTDELEDDTEALEEEADELEDDTEALEEEADELEDDTEALEEEADELEDDTDELEDDTEALEEEADELEDDTEELEEEADELEDDTDDLEEDGADDEDLIDHEDDMAASESVSTKALDNDEFELDDDDFEDLEDE